MTSLSALVCGLRHELRHSFYTLSHFAPHPLLNSLSVSHPRGKSSCQPSAREGPCGAPGDRGHQGLLDPVCQWVATLGDAWNSGSPLSLIPGLYLSVFLPSDELSVTDEAGQCEDVHLSIQRMCITVRAVRHTRGLIFCPNHVCWHRTYVCVNMRMCLHVWDYEGTWDAKTASVCLAVLGKI